MKSIENIFEEINDFPCERNQYSLGKLCYLFIIKNPIFINKLAPLVERSLKIDGFKKNVMHAYAENCKNEKVAILQKLDASDDHTNTNSFYAPKLDAIDKKLQLKTIRQLMDNLNNELNANQRGLLEHLNKCYQDIHGKDGSSYIKENYANYRIGDILYSKYQKKKCWIDMLNLKYSKVVEDKYGRAGIDIRSEDSQFNKYSLVSLNKNIQILNDKDSQTIYDDRIGKYFWIKVPRRLLSSIEQLIENKMLSKISFRVDYVEFGEPMRFEISSLPELSKFYSTNEYNNKLWVQHDAKKSSLTFEELVENFEVIDDGVVTQVIHLEYKSEGKEFFITHLDHEFIIYTLDNYQERLSNAKTKGARKIKTFKIDDSIIPFYIRINGGLFLLQVLYSYFKNRDLIREYFEKIN